MLTRRRLIAGATVMPALCARKSRPERLHIGSQTNTYGVPVRSFEALLKILADFREIGYAAFETNFKSMDPLAGRAAECRKAFESAGVRFLGPHGGFKLWDRAALAAELGEIDRIAAYSADMGASHFLLSGRALPHMEGRLDQDALVRKCDALNKTGEKLRGRGLRLCYHNHFAEFTDQPTEISQLVEHTDPKVVWLNYDTGNHYGHGPSAAEFSARYFQRIAVYHIKDVVKDANGKNVSMDLGAGKVDLAGAVKPLLDSDWEGWLIVEREGAYPRAANNPAQLLRQCRQYVKQITGV
jgi:inosose dehydratase